MQRGWMGCGGQDQFRLDRQRSSNANARNREMGEWLLVGILKCDSTSNKSKKLTLRTNPKHGRFQTILLNSRRPLPFSFYFLFGVDLNDFDGSESTT